MHMAKSNAAFGRTALPFLAMMGLGSWGLAQFLKMPIDVKDARAKEKRENREKFDLAKEHERFKNELGDTPDTYENVKIPGPKNPYRKAAD